MCQSLEFRFIICLFKLACLTFDQLVRPISLYFKLHDLYVCLNLFCELYFQFIMSQNLGFQFRILLSLISLFDILSISPSHFAAYKTAYFLCVITFKLWTLFPIYYVPEFRISV